MTRTGILEGQIGMDAALERVASSDWADRARTAVRILAADFGGFTSDDVRGIAGDPPAPNAIGAMLHEFAERGEIVMIGTTRSRRPEAHGRRVVRWRGR